MCVCVCVCVCAHVCVFTSLSARLSDRFIDSVVTNTRERWMTLVCGLDHCGNAAHTPQAPHANSVCTQATYLYTHTHTHSHTHTPTHTQKLQAWNTRTHCFTVNQMIVSASWHFPSRDTQPKQWNSKHSPPPPTPPPPPHTPHPPPPHPPTTSVCAL